MWAVVFLFSVFNIAYLAAGYKGFHSFHILRHTECTRMAESGMDVKVLQVIMGYSDAVVTLKVYDHVDKERMKKEIQKIENVI